MRVLPTLLQGYANYMPFAMFLMLIKIVRNKHRPPLVWVSFANNGRSQGRSGRPNQIEPQIVQSPSPTQHNIRLRQCKADDYTTKRLYPSTSPSSAFVIATQFGK